MGQRPLEATLSMFETNKRESVSPSWDGGDEIIMLLALATVSMSGMVFLDADAISAKQASSEFAELEETHSAPPPPEAQIPVSSISPLQYRDALPPMRPLKPGEQISETEGFIDVFGGPVNERIWVRHASERDQGFWRNDFRQNRILTDAGGLALEINRQTDKPDRPWPWSAGEINSRKTYGYGRYEAFMSPARGSGLVSSFFVYTGAFFGDPQDEIDIEFLGRNPTQVEFNSFRNGRPRGHKVFDLPFDATESLNLYAFEWHPDAITFFIDGVAVHRIDSEDHSLPRTPGRIYGNIWTGSIFSWHGRPNFEPGVTAKFGCISFQKFGTDTRQCSDIFQARQPYEPQLDPVPTN